MASEYLRECKKSSDVMVKVGEKREMAFVWPNKDGSLSFKIMAGKCWAEGTCLIGGDLVECETWFWEDGGGCAPQPFGGIIEDLQRDVNRLQEFEVECREDNQKQITEIRLMMRMLGEVQVLAADYQIS